MSLLGGDQELLDPFLQASIGTEGHGGPCLIFLYLLAGCTILMVTQAKELLKTEAMLPKHDHGETRTKHMIIQFIEIPGKPGAGAHLSS